LVGIGRHGGRAENVDITVYSSALRQFFQKNTPQQEVSCGAKVRRLCVKKLDSSPACLPQQTFDGSDSTRIAQGNKR
jgi:hypothetical protein